MKTNKQTITLSFGLFWLGLLEQQQPELMTGSVFNGYSWGYSETQSQN